MFRPGMLETRTPGPTRRQKDGYRWVRHATGLSNRSPRMVISFVGPGDAPRCAAAMPATTNAARKPRQTPFRTVLLIRHSTWACHGLRSRACPGYPSAVHKRYFVTTFGCQMNAHDSERIKGLLEDLG